MAAKYLPDIAVLRQVLKCDPETGRLFWLPRPRHFFRRDRDHRKWNTRYAGAEAFTTINAGGYRVAAIFDQKFYGHRVVFAFANGRWPVGEIDHIDGDRTNNKISNLREASSLDNSRNSACRAGRSHPGIRQHANGRWRVGIGVAGRKIHLGYFNSYAHALATRKAAEEKYGFHPNHGRKS